MLAHGPVAAATARAAHPASFSFDIEDWYHSELIPERDREAAGAASVVETGTTAILDLLRTHAIRATFFVLGDVARAHPALVRRIVDDGHELGCHGMDHRPLWKLDRATLRTQLAEFRRIVEGILGRFPVIGFRAPCFSLDRSTAWALDVLGDAGYLYDSSVFPARVKMYGVAQAPVTIYRPDPRDIAREDRAASIVEFPVAVGRCGPVRLPVAGGFYLRALPFLVSRTVLDLIHRRRPFALYLHPREWTPEPGRLRMGLVNSFISYTNLASVPRKLERLARRYPFLPMREVLVQRGDIPASAAAANRGARRV